MQARFYLPMYGRFASPDPARDQHFEETQSWNIYSYVQNNPVMKIDPTGMLMGDPIRDMGDALANLWRENVSDPLERLNNKIGGNGWTENRNLPNAGEPQVQVPLMFCGGVVPVGVSVPMPSINFDLPGPSAPAVSTNGTAALAPGVPVTVPVPAVAMTGGPGQGDGNYKPAPRGNLDGEIKAERVKSKSERARWKDGKGNTYEWDSQHGKLEKYNKGGKHQGEFDPETGKQTKPADPKRKIER